MAGKFATIISLGLAQQYNDRAIVKAMREVRAASEIRVQPIDSEIGYLVVNNKKSKADAERDLMALLGAYKGFGGVEYDTDSLPQNAPEPAMAGLNNDQVKFIPNPPSDVIINPELIKRARRWDKAYNA